MKFCASEFFLTTFWLIFAILSLNWPQKYQKSHYNQAPQPSKSIPMSLALFYFTLFSRLFWISLVQFYKLSCTKFQEEMHCYDGQTYFVCTTFFYPSVLQTAKLWIISGEFQCPKMLIFHQKKKSTSTKIKSVIFHHVS